MVQVAKVLPKFSRLFWQRVGRVYKDLGGKIEREETSTIEREDEIRLVEGGS